MVEVLRAPSIEALDVGVDVGAGGTLLDYAPPMLDACLLDWATHTSLAPTGVMVLPIEGVVKPLNAPHSPVPRLPVYYLWTTQQSEDVRNLHHADKKNQL